MNSHCGSSIKDVYNIFLALMGLGKNMFGVFSNLAGGKRQ
jgi:hypothetical protein